MSESKCSAQEIENKRRLAMERNQRYKEEQKSRKKQQQNNNNEKRPTLNVMDVMSNVQEPKSAQVPTLTAEQKAVIERKRLDAIERAKANKLISPAVASDLVSKKISPGKVQFPSKAVVANNRSSLNPYLKPQLIYDENTIVNKPQTHPYIPEQTNQSGKATTSMTNTRPAPYPKPSSNTLPKSKIIEKPVLCSIEVISEDRFVAKTDVFNDIVINEFKKISSSSYDQKTRSWSFALAHYELLMKNLHELKGIVNVKKVPEFILKHLYAETLTTNETSLDEIEDTLTETLFPFQREGVCFGIANGGRLLLADDMGLGKTRQALAIADFYKNDWPLLILTTASLRHMWHSEILDLLPNVSVHYIRIVESHNDSIADAKVVICSYTGMELNMTKLKMKGFGVVIFDESHSLKNSKTKQTINATILGEQAARVVLITGTPALSRPVELYPQLAIINKRFANYFQFTERYCEGHSDKFGYRATGSSNLAELNVVLRKKFMIRRTKDDVYSELGQKNREVVELSDLKISSTDAKEMNNFATEYHKSEGKRKDQKQVLLEWFPKTANLKADAVCRFIESMAKESEEKFLVFAVHHVVMNAVSECLRNNKISHVRIDGSTKAESRNSIVESFQNDPSIRCAVLSIRACSVGLTLTAANKVVFAELDWTPSNIIQAEGRVHRIGQERPVKCIFLIAKGTADEVMWKMLHNKQHNLSNIGLIANNEHFSDNLKISKFEAGPSNTPKNKDISSYFQKKESPESTTSEVFHTCEEDLDDDDNAMWELVEQQVKHVEDEMVQAKKSVESELLADINFDDEEDFIMC